MSHVMVVEQLAVALQLLVEPAQRRALVARDHGAGVEAAAAIGAVLVERQPHQALHSREEYAALVQEILVIEGDIAARMLGLPVPVALHPVSGRGVRATAAHGRRRHRKLLPLRHW